MLNNNVESEAGKVSKAGEVRGARVSTRLLGRKLGEAGGRISLHFTFIKLRIF